MNIDLFEPLKKEITFLRKKLLCASASWMTAFSDYPKWSKNLCSFNPLPCFSPSTKIDYEECTYVCSGLTSDVGSRGVVFPVRPKG